jgi:GNAT superfamily N-acetyltransferase
MWVDEPYRGRGYGRALLDAIIVEAGRRGVLRIWVASYGSLLRIQYCRRLRHVVRVFDWLVDEQHLLLFSPKAAGIGARSADPASHGVRFG